MSKVDENGVQRMDPNVDLFRTSPAQECLSPFLLLFWMSRGVFPFLRDQGRSLWWSPNPRAVLLPSNVHVSRSLRRVMRRGQFKVTADLAFAEVVRGCRTVPRGKIPTVQSWINDDIEETFTRLHRFGHAHSIETWRDGELVGGLWGIAVGRVFAGYSMFHREANASKVALVRLSEKLAELGFPLIDCQAMNPHLKRMGAQLMPRDQFNAIVDRASRGSRELGLWTRLFETRSQLGV